MPSANINRFIFRLPTATQQVGNTTLTYCMIPLQSLYGEDVSKRF